MQPVQKKHEKLNKYSAEQMRDQRNPEVHSTPHIMSRTTFLMQISKPVYLYVLKSVNSWVPRKPKE